MGPRSNIARDLETIRSADNYYNWIFSEIRPFLGSRILECGAGIGSITSKFLNCRFDKLIATDYDAIYIPFLEEICSHYPSAMAMILDLDNLTKDQLNFISSSQINTIVMINVLEHIKNDQDCIRKLCSAMDAGSRIILFCPAFNLLYSKLDESYGHYRRYDENSLKLMVQGTDLDVSFTRYYNIAGFFAWILLHKILRITDLNEHSVYFFNKLIPLLRGFESMFNPSFGLSVLSVFVKK